MRSVEEILQAVSDSETETAFSWAREWIRANAPALEGSLSTLEGDYSLAGREYMVNKISFEEFSRYTARANDGICKLLSTVTSQVTPCFQSAYHALTCDRESQTDHFELLFKQRREKGEQVQFYYLYGGRYQSHESLSKRLAQERAGMRRGLSMKPVSSVGVGAAVFDTSDDLEYSKTEFIARLCEAFLINPNAYADLSQKRLDFILQESSLLNGLQAADFAMCFIEVSEWDNEQVPAAANWFVHEFCNVAMPAAAPVCLFFFGVNYRESDDRTPREIEVALRAAQHTDGLPELTMVAETDLEDWIRNYARPLGLPNISARDALLDEILINVRAKQQSSPRKLVPGKENLLHMDDVESELKRVIDKRNE